MVHIDINCTIEDVNELDIFKRKIKEYMDKGYTIKSYEIEKYENGFGHVRVKVILTDHKSLFSELKNKRFIKKVEKILKELI